MNKTFSTLIILISTQMDRDNETTHVSIKTPELVKEFLSIQADIKKMSSDFMTSEEVIEKAFAREKPTIKTHRVKGELASIHKVLNKKNNGRKSFGTSRTPSRL